MQPGVRVPLRHLLPWRQKRGRPGKSWPNIWCSVLSNSHEGSDSNPIPTSRPPRITSGRGRGTAQLSSDTTDLRTISRAHTTTSTPSPVHWPVCTRGDRFRQLSLIEVYRNTAPPSRVNTRIRGQRYKYPSHSLRFELQDPLESETQFVQRANRDAGTEEAGGRPVAGQVKWVVGANQRNLGSLHQDMWETSGIELRQSGKLAVYPAGGWWKNNRPWDRLDNARFR